MNPQVDIIRNPVDPDSLLLTPAPVRIRLIRNRTDLDAAKIIDVAGIPMYYTIEDLLRALWVQMGKTDDYAPENVFLGVPTEDAPLDTATYTNAKFLMYDANQNQLIGLGNPYKKTIYKDFIAGDGTRQPVQISDRTHMTLEDVFYGEEAVPELHAYLLSGLLTDYGGRAAIGERAWNGAVYPFYRTEGLMKLTQKGRDAINVSVVNKRVQLDLIRKAYTNTPIMKDPQHRLFSTGIKQISYIWPEKPAEFPGADMLFYNIDANKDRPFMRFYPRSGPTVNKLYQPSALEPPYINDPLLLQSWAAEKSPNAGADVLVVKSEVRHANPPLYGSFRINQDGSADFLMLPPKDVRVLSPQSELVRFYEAMAAMMNSTSYSIDGARYHRGTFTYGLRLPLGSQKLTTNALAGRVKLLGAYFQTLGSIGDGSLITLRYNAVSNYFNENNVGMFLTQYIEKGGDLYAAETVETLMETFKLSEEQASAEVRAYQERITEYGIADHDDKNFVALKNPGIDITIYAKHPTYTAHIYRVDSLAHLKRISFLVNLLLTSRADTWHGEAIVEESVSEAAYTEAASALSPQNQDQQDVAAYNIGDLDFLNEIIDESKESLEEAEVAPAQAPASAQAQTQQQAKPIPSSMVKDRDCAETASFSFKESDTKQFYIKTLKSLDKDLFDFKDKSLYSSRCQATDYKQPMGLTKEQFELMLDVYKEDLQKDMAFIIYGTKGWEEQVRKSVGKETYTILRYGTDPDRPNYYFCSEYLCLKDSIIVRPKDYASTVKRDGKTPKPLNSCPFCCGTLIENLENPAKGQTILKRYVKKQGNELQTDIGFHSTKNPAGFSLPCCFIPKGEKSKKKQELSWENPIFAHIRTSDITTGPVAVSTPAKKTDLVDQGRITPNYTLLQTEIGRAYVVDDVKYPAKPGVVAKCGQALDIYFGQNSNELASRDKLKQVVNPHAYGFFRIGVYNNVNERHNSFFNALAPLLNVNSAEEVVGLFGISKDGISATILPKVFLNLNFGNLLLEFFEPGDAEPTDQALESFSNLHLQLSIAQYKVELSRLYRSYRRFIHFLRGTDPRTKFTEFIADPNPKPKQYRQFFHILAEKGLLVRKNVEDLTNGLAVVVLEYDADPTDPGTRITVKCPPYGYDLGRYRNNDVAFMTVDKDGFWEPLIYADAQTAGSAHLLSGLRRSYFRIPVSRFSAQTYYVLPQPLITRYTEYTEQCGKGAVYRGLYTAQSGVDAAGLIPLSKIVVELLKTRTPVRGLVRDSYNHLVGVTVREPGSKQDIIIPAADDGYISYSSALPEIHLNYDVNSPKEHYRGYATADQVYNFYTGTQIKPLQIINPAYVLRSFKCISSAGTSAQCSTLVGFTLSNNVVVPCRPTSYSEFKEKHPDIPVEMSALPYKKDIEFEYEINDEIRKDGEKPDTQQKHEYDDDILKREELEEIYEHYRLSFSRWLRSDEAGPEFRNKLRELIMESPSVNPAEKRRQLAYIVGPMLASWLLPRTGDIEHIQTLVRKDCMKLDKGQCSGHCGWVEGAAGSGSCRLHVPATADIGSGTPIADVADYFVYRLIYELVKLPLRYREIEEGAVSRITPLRTDIHLKDQWIIPENVPAWYELIYKVKPTDYSEKPRFYEEFAQHDRFKTQETLDDLLTQFFGEDVAGNLTVKPIGEKKSDTTYYGPAHDVVVAYDVADKADRSVWTETAYRENEPLSQELLDNLSAILGNHPVVFIEEGNDEIRYGLKISSHLKKENVYIVLYRINDDGFYEASVVKPYGLLLDYVPLSMLEGSAVYDTIKNAPITVRKIKVVRQEAP